MTCVKVRERETPRAEPANRSDIGQGNVCVVEVMQQNKLSSRRLCNLHLIGFCKSILVRPLCFAREIAIAQGHNP